MPVAAGRGWAGSRALGRGGREASLVTALSVPGPEGHSLLADPAGVTSSHPCGPTLRTQAGLRLPVRLCALERPLAGRPPAPEAPEALPDRGRCLLCSGPRGLQFLTGTEVRVPCPSDDPLTPRHGIPEPSTASRSNHGATRTPNTPVLLNLAPDCPPLRLHRARAHVTHTHVLRCKLQPPPRLLPVSRQRLPGMQRPRAPGSQGQSPGGMGALGPSRVILLTYVLAALEFTCLFMQFSTLPASVTRPQGLLREPRVPTLGPARTPVFQYLTRSLGLDSVAFGYLQTLFGVLQLLGGPVFGRFADQRGARAAFTLAFAASSALYLLLAAACSPALPGVALLFASRLPSAFMHVLPAAQMVITDLTTPEERPAALGRLGLCFGVGVILGSLLGGTLSTSCG
ncbi:Solute carrier family 22 member 18 [Galemys pyrenaicus]|uniref:Solute carrier family 22 member 18 n=1 Tax=Galemys pyrenaicus TaxID=202257 RepID=A0A8J6AJ12_GALPY|nr:Solute carrier family 22 member 18 [Galemys pyrenaicus]